MAQTYRAVIVRLALIFAMVLLAAPAWSQVRTGPAWSELSSADKQLLAPFQQEWDKWDMLRKNKWLAMAKRYPTLAPAEQQRIRERMAGWAKLSTQEREAARAKFRGMKQLPPDQRKDLSNKWMEYQSLPPEERQALGLAPRAPGETAPATAVKPQPAAVPAPPAGAPARGTAPAASGAPPGATTAVPPAPPPAVAPAAPVSPSR